MVFITIVTGTYKPTNISWGPHIVYLVVTPVPMGPHKKKDIVASHPWSGHGFLSGFRSGKSIFVWVGHEPQIFVQRSGKKISLVIWWLYNGYMMVNHWLNITSDQWVIWCAGWWFQTWLDDFPFHIWDVIRNPLTDPIIFQDGLKQPPTRNYSSYTKHQLYYWVYHQLVGYIYIHTKY